MANSLLRINEIFYSLQGEGFHTGTPVVFVRLSGCNLKCDFCDTDFDSYQEMSVQQVVEIVKQYPARVVVLTGGEPSLQDIGELVTALHAAGMRVHIETNGTRPLPPGIDWITCSPKAGARLAITRCDELKIVYTGQDVETIAAGLECGHRFLQPCSCKNTKEVIEYILNNPHWRLSLQTHKFLDIR